LDIPIGHSNGAVSFSLLDSIVPIFPVVRTRTEHEELLRKISVEEGEEGDEGEYHV
jgi:hypothetical protein